MAVFSKKISANSEWREAFESYESISGFEPMYQEDVDAGRMMIREAWNRNIAWLEDVVATCTSIHTPN